MPIPAEPTAVERQSFTSIAAERIKDAILDGTLAPGEALTDQKLQRWLGMSRTPIREALKDLERAGFIEIAAQRFTRVTSAAPAQRDELLQTLGALTGGIIRVTTPALSAAQRDDFASLIDTALGFVSARDVEASGRLEWRIIESFLDACPNAALIRSTRGLVESLLYRVSITRTTHSVQWHDLEVGWTRLREAVLDADAMTAELAIEHSFRLHAVT